MLHVVVYSTTFQEFFVLAKLKILRNPSKVAPTSKVAPVYGTYFLSQCHTWGHFFFALAPYRSLILSYNSCKETSPFLLSISLL